MKTPVFPALLLCLAGLYASTAYADTDYHCLSQCVNNGQPSSVCLKQCSYNIKVTPPVSNATGSVSAANAENAQLSAHNIFKPLIPAGNTIQLQAKTKMPEISLDRTCLSQCLANKMQYELCTEQCVQPSAGRTPVKKPPTP